MGAWPLVAGRGRSDLGPRSALRRPPRRQEAPGPGGVGGAPPASCPLVSVDASVGLPHCSGLLVLREGDLGYDKDKLETCLSLASAETRFSLPGQRRFGSFVRAELCPHRVCGA